MPIKVTIFKRKGRKNFEAQWVDPTTKKKKTRTTGCNRRREAEREASRIENELNSKGREKKQVTWKQFRDLYEMQVLAGMALKTQKKNRSILNAVEEIIDPQSPAEIDASAISHYQAELRSKERAAFTIKGHLTILGGILAWGKRQGFLDEVPHIEKPKRATGRTIRQITAEEFDRMIEKVPKVVGDDPADSWEFYLRGLWCSGLRLTESLKLHWSDPTDLCVDFSGKRPMFKISAQAEKGRKNRLLPMTPEFYELLQTVPQRERRGLVFNPKPLRMESFCGADTNWISRIVSRIGETAKVRTSDRSGKPKFASAHDLRRAFGYRWAQRLKPHELMLLMRHESIQTTMTFYIGQQSDDAAESIWGNTDAGVANVFTNIEDSEKPSH